MSNPKQQANDLLVDYKQRLSPYVKAMKERGYFGVAAEKQAQLQAQGESQNTQAQQGQAQQAKQPAPQGQQPAKTGVDTGLFDHNQTTGGNGLDGDFLSINADVAPDSTDVENRAPDVAGATRPTPKFSFDLD